MHDLFLFLAGLLASLIDTIGGGGGLITLPSLLIVGVAPATAIGTNRLQSCFAELTAILKFSKHAPFRLRQLLFPFLTISFGALVGAYLVMQIHPTHLKHYLPIPLFLIFIYFLFSPSLRDTAVRARISRILFFVSVGSLIAFYNGFFGPGTGSLWIIALMYFLGLKTQEAVMQAKPFNLIGNLVAMLFFAIKGHVAYWTLLFMGPGQILGAFVGSELVIRKGARIIRPVFIVAFIGLMAKLLIWK